MVGIDLGTTHSLIGYFDKGEVHLVPMGDMKKLFLILSIFRLKSLEKGTPFFRIFQAIILLVCLTSGLWNPLNS